VENGLIQAEMLMLESANRKVMHYLLPNETGKVSLPLFPEGVPVDEEIKKYNWVNPPPSDRRCECCGKHISELEPFDGPAGAILVKNFRRLCVDYQVDAVWECRDCIRLSLEEFNKKHKQHINLNLKK
jgi:hypothetical protein